MRAEIERRYGDDVRVVYYSAAEPDVKTRFTEQLAEFEKRGLLFPVTVVDGVPVYDGAVSYPAVMRAVQNKLVEREQRAGAQG